MVRLSLFLLLTISLFSWAQDLPESVEKSTVQSSIEDTLSDEKDVAGTLHKRTASVMLLIH